jgi:hypothetical protein
VISNFFSGKGASPAYPYLSFINELLQKNGMVYHVILPAKFGVFVA